MSDMHHIGFKCCRCGEERHGEVNALPQFAFELVAIADKAGFVGAFDPNYARALVFCSDECLKASLTKKGYFPLRIKQVAKAGAQ